MAKPLTYPICFSHAGSRLLAVALLCGALGVAGCVTATAMEPIPKKIGAHQRAAKRVGTGESLPELLQASNAVKLDADKLRFDVDSASLDDFMELTERCRRLHIRGQSIDRNEFDRLSVGPVRTRMKGILSMLLLDTDNTLINAVGEKGLVVRSRHEMLSQLRETLRAKAEALAGAKNVEAEDLKNSLDKIMAQDKQITDKVQALVSLDRALLALQMQINDFKTRPVQNDSAPIRRPEQRMSLLSLTAGREVQEKIFAVEDKQQQQETAEQRAAEKRAREASDRTITELEEQKRQQLLAEKHAATTLRIKEEAEQKRREEAERPPETAEEIAAKKQQRELAEAIIENRQRAAENEERQRRLEEDAARRKLGAEIKAERKAAEFRARILAITPRASTAMNVGLIVEWHPDASGERDKVGDTKEINRINTAVDGLRESGHDFSGKRTKPLKGNADLFEVRVASGRSQWRVIYGHARGTWWALAVTPTSKENPNRFENAVDKAKGSLAALSSAA